MQIARQTIRRLLESWRTGEIDTRRVHEEAEELFDQLEERKYPRDHPQSILVEILSQLEILNHQLITSDDIPAMLAFLDARPGEELEAWERWQRYWDELDLDRRIAALRDDPYYSAYVVPE